MFPNFGTFCCVSFRLTIPRQFSVMRLDSSCLSQVDALHKRRVHRSLRLLHIRRATEASRSHHWLHAPLVSGAPSRLFWQCPVPPVNTSTAHRHVFLLRVASLEWYLYYRPLFAVKRYGNACTIIAPVRQAFVSFGFVSYILFVARSAAAHAVRFRAFCRVAALVLALHVSPLEPIFRPFFVTQ
jgi:hypothetical protein